MKHSVAELPVSCAAKDNVSALRSATRPEMETWGREFLTPDHYKGSVLCKDFVTWKQCSHVGGVKSVADADCLEDAVRAVEGVHGIEPRLVVKVLVVAGGGVGVGLLQPLCPQAVL